MAESPKKTLGEISEEAKSEKDFRKRIAHYYILRRPSEGHKVFFYPGAGRDWESLRHLTHLCNTFIFCDWGVTPDSVTGDFDIPGLALDFIEPLGQDKVDELSSRLHLPADIRVMLGRFDGQEGRVKPWGKYAALRRKVGDVDRRIYFLYLGIEGVTAFSNLFIPGGAAPQMIGVVFAVDFSDWNGPFGRVVLRT